MIPVQCRCAIDDVVESVTVVMHVFTVGNVPIFSRYYYPAHADHTESMEQCHDEALIALKLVLVQHGYTIEDGSV